MTHLVLVILAVIWAAVLLPPFLQNRSESRPADSISTFRSQLSVLERRSVGVGGSQGADPARGPRTVRPVSPSVAFAAVPRGQVDRARLARLAAKRRRRDVLVTLMAAAVITLAIGLVSAPVLLLHLAIDVLLGGYVFLLVRRRKLSEERSMKVRYMSQAQSRRPAQPARRPVLDRGVALRPAAAAN